MQDKKLKELFDTIPSPDGLYSLGMEGSKADIILVDAEKDKKLSMLKQLSAAMVKGLYANPALIIKKIAGLVSILLNILIDLSHQLNYIFDQATSHYVFFFFIVKQVGLNDT